MTALALTCSAPRSRQIGGLDASALSRSPLILILYASRMPTSPLYTNAFSLVGWLGGCLVGWLVGGLVGWLVGWLVG